MHTWPTGGLWLLGGPNPLEIEEQVCSFLFLISAAVALEAGDRKENATWPSEVLDASELGVYCGMRKPVSLLPEALGDV